MRFRFRGRGFVVLGALAIALCAVAPAAGSTWKVVDIPDGPVGGILWAVSCPSPRLCVASGTNSAIVSSTDPTAGAGAWKAAGQMLVVTHPTPGGGVVTSDPPGLSCETFFCGAEFSQGSLVRLIATPRKGFAFAGYSDACRGPTCSLTMDGERRVTVSFVRFGELPRMRVRKVTADGTAVLTIRAGGPGRLVLSGKDVRRQVSDPRQADNVKLPIVA